MGYNDDDICEKARLEPAEAPPPLEARGGIAAVASTSSLEWHERYGKAYSRRFSTDDSSPSKSGAVIALLACGITGGIVGFLVAVALGRIFGLACK